MLFWPCCCGICGCSGGVPAEIQVVLSNYTDGLNCQYCDDMNGTWVVPRTASPGSCSYVLSSTGVIACDPYHHLDFTITINLIDLGGGSMKVQVVVEYYPGRAITYEKTYGTPPDCTAFSSVSIPYVSDTASSPYLCTNLSSTTCVITSL